MAIFMTRLSQRFRGPRAKAPAKSEWHARARLASKARPTVYGGLRERTAAGLHEFLFRLFARYVTPHSEVLDLGSGEGAWAMRLKDASYEVTACDANPRGGR